MVKYALISFLTGKDKKRVVPVKEIKDFKPKSVEDFDRSKVYEVLCPVLRRQDSDTTEVAYSANILLLAASSESMLHRAKTAGISLPIAFKSSVDKPCGSKKVEDSVTMAHRASRRTKRQVNAALVAACQQRMSLIGEGVNEEKAAKEDGAGGDSVSEAVKQCKVLDGGKQDEEHLASNTDVHNESSPIKKPKNKSAKSEASSNSSASYESSTTEAEKLKRMLAEKQIGYNYLMRENRLLEAANLKLKSQLESWKAAFDTFQRAVPVSDSDDHCQQMQGKFIISPTKEVNHKTSTAPPVNRCLFQVTDADAGDTGTLSIAQEVLKSKPVMLTPKPPTESKPAVTPPKRQKSPLKSKSPAKKRKTEKGQSKIKSLEPGEKYNGDLFQSIVAALQGQEALPQKLTEVGKKTMIQVDIGNDTWIKQDLWENKIKKSSVKLSILVRDLAEEVWGYKKCAMMSLAGGKSPKTPDASVKPQAPRGQVEAILAVVRAKKYIEGMTIEEHLDEFISKTGEGYLRDKFKDSADKFKRDLKLAKEKVATEREQKD